MLAAVGVPGAGLGGVLRMTWVQDRLAHVLEHSDADESAGTFGRWIGVYGWWWLTVMCEVPPWRVLRAVLTVALCPERRAGARGRLSRYTPSCI